MTSQTKMMRVKGYMRASEAARRLGLASSSIYRLIDNGKVEGIRVGTRRYVYLVSLSAYIGPAGADALSGVYSPEAALAEEQADK